MSLKYNGSYEDLKLKLIGVAGNWDETDSIKKIFRTDGAVMSWFKSTGTIQFQGKQENIANLKSKVNGKLSSDKSSEIIKPIDEAPFNLRESKDDSIVVSISDQFLNDQFQDSEIIIGLVSAVGTEISRVINPLKDRLLGFGYEVKNIKVSSLLPASKKSFSEYQRIKHYMTEGDKMRKESNNHGILAYGAAKLINESRGVTIKKTAYIIDSLKHPDEVTLLRKVYGQGFYLIGIHSDKKRRLAYLTNDKSIEAGEANELIEIDEDEKVKHGQKTRDTFHLSDFYLNLGKNDDQVKNTLQRFLDLIFGHPFKNPTFDEFAMYMAFSSSIRSGDLSRQVGAVISKNQQIIATGANEVPRGGGGHYWAEIEEETGIVNDIPEGKDYTRNEDSNKKHQNEIIEGIEKSLKDIDGLNPDILDQISKRLRNSPIKDLTEFGRVVHAEMQAILSCAKEGISCCDSTLYCTTFPCHNCAKHLIASGVERVVYVEPYPKSKAIEFHKEAITTEQLQEGFVLFEPFIGVGARRFLDLFSMNSGAGSNLKRKNNDGSIVEWTKEKAKLRVVLMPESYLEVEKAAINVYHESSKSK